jgi:hypothetical protein
MVSRSSLEQWSLSTRTMNGSFGRCASCGCTSHLAALASRSQPTVGLFASVRYAFALEGIGPAVMGPALLGSWFRV